LKKIRIIFFGEQIEFKMNYVKRQEQDSGAIGLVQGRREYRK
jgi:TnpA family transposase